LDTDATARAQKLRLVRGLVEQCIKYVEIVVQQGVAMCLDAGKLEELAEIDRRRTGTHKASLPKLRQLTGCARGMA